MQTSEEDEQLRDIGVLGREILEVSGCDGRDPEPFDWYQRYGALKELINKYVKPSDHVLNVGCGNSRLSEDMYEDGFKRITNIDFSPVVISAMKEKTKGKDGLACRLVCDPDLTMDVTELEFQAGEFDAVIDKGTLDTILCGDDSEMTAERALAKISRVLKPKGVYFCVSYGQPQHRDKILKKAEFGFDVTLHKIAKPTISTSVTIANDDRDYPNLHFVYVCQKRGSETVTK